MVAIRHKHRLLCVINSNYCLPKLFSYGTKVLNANLFQQRGFSVKKKKKKKNNVGNKREVNLA